MKSKSRFGISLVLGLALLGVSVGLAWAQLPDNHFLCYKARKARGEPGFPAINVSLADQFEAKGFTVVKPRAICNPGDKDGGGIVDPNTHLEAYKIKRVRGELRHGKQGGLLVVNRLGELSVDTIRPDRLLVPSAKDLVDVPPVPDPNLHNVDHYNCYKVRPTKGASVFQGGLFTSVSDQFESVLYEVRKLAHLCAPVDKRCDKWRHRPRQPVASCL